MSTQRQEFTSINLPTWRSDGRCPAERALEAFQAPETVEGYDCDYCRRKGVPCTRQISITKAPLVLAIHIQDVHSGAGTSKALVPELNVTVAVRDCAAASP